MFVLQRTFEFRQKNDKMMKEDVSVDVKDNYVQYHVKDDDSEVWVIEDFNRVSVAKMALLFYILVGIAISNSHKKPLRVCVRCVQSSEL